MGKRGPAPLPAELHARRGTLRPERHGDGTPFALAGKPVDAPAAPAHLNEAEAETWEELVPIFHAAGILDGGDVFALEAMIVAVCRARLADELLRLESTHEDGSPRAYLGLVVRGDRGYVTHPLVKISRDSWAEARSWFAKFGATPSDRVGLAVGGLQGMTLAEQLRQALAGDEPAPAQLELGAALVAEVCDATRKRDGAPCLGDPGHAGRHRFQ
jgi:phage terminase small subunit